MHLAEASCDCRCILVQILVDFKEHTCVQVSKLPRDIQANCLGISMVKMLCLPVGDTSTLNLVWSTEGTSQ